MNEENKNLEYWRKNAEEDYRQVPISVIRYIAELEIAMEVAKGYSTPVAGSTECDCETPKPKNPYNDIDKHYCIYCDNLIA